MFGRIKPTPLLERKKLKIEGLPEEPENPERPPVRLLLEIKRHQLA
ncbi:MAG: hypothetical protein PWQ79_627 [Thermococcaceae archaeon]|nr:hypothetical protein [Thermococcaceae archaeon]MDK2913712.1 hypothetical protein [Thermococcaceae archaeon]